MTIPILQSQLNAIGYGNVSFPDLRKNDQKMIATQVLLATGRNREARLLEINNVIALSGITYINDTPSRIGQR